MIAVSCAHSQTRRKKKCRWLTNFSKHIFCSRSTQRSWMLWRTWNRGQEHSCIHKVFEVALCLGSRVSSTPVLDPMLPFLPTGKVILSTPLETNAYITTWLQTNCSCYSYTLWNVSARAGPLVVIMHAQKPRQLDHKDYINCEFDKEYTE